MQPQLQFPQQLDPQVVNMAKAIRQTESGGNASAQGKSGEYGAYQYTEPTWQKDASAAGINIPLKNATLEQQNQVAYTKIKKLKDAGYNPGQIASVWNAGEEEPDAYTGKFSNGQPSVGTNKRGVHFDVPAYAKSVATAYQTLKNGGQVGVDSQNPSSVANTQNTAQQSQDTTPSTDTSNAFNIGLTNIASGNSQANADKGIGAVKGGLQVLRDVAGVDTNPVVKGMLANAPAFSQNVDAEKQAIQPSNLMQRQGAQMSETLANILPVSEGAGAAKTVGGLIGKGLIGEKDAVLTAVSPRLTPSIAGETPTKTVGLLNKIIPVASKKLQQIADAVRPLFNPKGTWSSNAQAAETEIGNESKNLESLIDKVNHPIVIKELGARLKNVEEPLSLKGTSFEKQIGPLKNAAVKLTQQAGGTVKGAFQSLRQFDNLVDKTWPTLWDRENAPMRNAVTAIRNEWKDFIEENLPKDSIYRDSLEKQTNLFNARDVFREKAANGELQQQGEIGTTALGRWAERNKGLINAGKRVGYGAATVGGGAELAHSLGLFPSNGQ